MIEDIIYKYTIEKLSLTDICKIYNIGKLKVKQILSDNNIPINKKGGISLNRNETPFTIDIENKYLICNNCGNEYDDVENKSGIITKHLKECSPNIIHPSETQKRNIKKYKGIYWHFDYFTLKEKTIQEIIKCAECDWITNDIINISGSYTKHIEKEHNNLNDFLLKYPSEKKYFNKHNKKEERLELLSQDSVSCKICGEKMFSINEKHLQTKHNISLLEYKTKYLGLKTLSNNTYLKFKNNLKDANLNMKPTWSSKAEIEIFNFIKDLGFNVEKSKNRKLLNGKEIDVLIEEKKLCLEYNCLYYHTEKMGKDKNYHLSKTVSCNNLGYKLIHIFEDEWFHKEEIIKNKLKHLLNVNNSIKIGGRNINVKKINNIEKNIFLKKYHIQGEDKSNIFYGAFYNDILVGVMTFNQKRHMTSNKENEFDLSRFATNSDYIINGLASKMIKIFINEFNPKSIISFADRRWTLDVNNNLYTKLGFELIKILNPNYTYYNNKINKFKRYHKFGFGKSNLKIKYPHLDFSKTEKELTSELGFQRIWDCGLFKYELKIKGEQ
jgi:hypothetical protein